MVRTQILLTEEQARALRRLAASQHLSVAELIRQGVDALLQSQKSIDREERKRRALAALGRFRSGKHDVSKDHDKYLSEALGR